MSSLTKFQKEKLEIAFGLSQQLQPWRNAYPSYEEDADWEDLCEKGYAVKQIDEGGKIQYSGTLEALKKVFRSSATENFFNNRCPVKPIRRTVN